MAESRRLRTQAERDADGTTWRATAASRPGFATYPDTAPGSPCWWARHGEQPPARPAPEPRPWTGPDPLRAGRATLFPTSGVVPGEPEPVRMPVGDGCVIPRVAEPDINHGPPTRPPHLGPVPDRAEPTGWTARTAAVFLLLDAVPMPMRGGWYVALCRRVWNFPNDDPPRRRWWHRYTRRNP